MTPDQVIERAVQLINEIIDVLEGENTDAAFIALTAALGGLIFHNAGSMSEAASKAADIGTDINAFIREAYLEFPEKAGA